MGAELSKESIESNRNLQQLFVKLMMCYTTITYCNKQMNDFFYYFLSEQSTRKGSVYLLDFTNCSLYTFISFCSGVSQREWIVHNKLQEKCVSEKQSDLVALCHLMNRGGKRRDRRQTQKIREWESSWLLLSLSVDSCLFCLFDLLIVKPLT